MTIFFFSFMYNMYNDPFSFFIYMYNDPFCPPFIYLCTQHIRSVLEMKTVGRLAVEREMKQRTNIHSSVHGALNFFFIRISGRPTLPLYQP